MAVSAFALVMTVALAFYLSARMSPAWSADVVPVDDAVRAAFARGAGRDAAESAVVYLTGGTREGVERVSRKDADGAERVTVIVLLAIRGDDSTLREYHEMRLQKGPDGIWTPLAWKRARQGRGSPFWTGGPTL